MSRSRTLNYRSVSTLNSDVIEWSRTVGQEISGVIGVPRSGMLAASLLALHSDLPIWDLPGFLAGLTPWSGIRFHQNPSRLPVLIVDDSVNSGHELRRVRQAVRTARPNVEVLYGAVYASPRGVARVDRYHEIVPMPRAFEWNILHHAELLSKSCMDIDGVLCRDPTDSENDDSVRYRRFLKSVEISYLPKYPGRTLVTSRLEMYRSATEDWLEENGVIYKDLVMLDLPNAKIRRVSRAHAPHKAAAYLKSGNELFIESRLSEGQLIHALTGLPVYVTDTHDFLSAPADATLIDGLRHAASRAKGVIQG